MGENWEAFGSVLLLVVVLLMAGLMAVIVMKIVTGLLVLPL